MRGLALGLLLAVVWSSSADACLVDSGRFNWNSKTESVTKMSVKSGGSCLIQTWTGGTVMFSSMRISAQARNGIADIKDGSTWRYRSRSGFKGNDEFVVTTCATARSGKGCAIVRVKVTID